MMIEAYKAWLSETIDTHRTIFSEIGRVKRVGDIAIEKDYWVTLVLRAIFSQSYGGHLVFKGGTSLSKGWNLIQRFSEDIDLAIDLICSRTSPSSYLTVTSLYPLKSVNAILRPSSVSLYTLSSFFTDAGVISGYLTAPFLKTS